MCNTIFGKYLSAISLILLAASCSNKELPKVAGGVPEFYFKGTVDDQPVTLEAGVDDYFMYTSWESTGEGGLRKGNLGPRNCGGCGPALEISFMLHQNEDLTAGIQPWRYKTLEDSDWMQRQFAAEVDAAGNSTFEWSFGDGTTSTEKDPVHTFSAPGTYEVCLTVDGNADCRSVICNDILIDSNACNASFSIHHEGNKAITFNANKETYVQYQWDFGDGKSASGPEVQHTYDYSGFYEACLTVTDAAGCQATMCREISANPGDHCLSGFSYRPAYDTAGTGHGVAITWTDAGGQVYQSNFLDKTHQHDSFEIKNVESYKENNQGQPTQSVVFSVDGYLYHIADPADSIRLVTEDTSKFAVASDDN
jgi:PKD repeat protein